MSPLRTPQEQAARNNRVAGMAVLFAATMAGAAYAAVPLYKLFCQVTGFAGTPQRAVNASDRMLATTMTVRFDANTDAALPWRFSTVQAQQQLKVGQNKLAFFEAENISSQPIVGRASFNVSPDIAGQYFTKVHCFCFNEQTLQPGEKVTMPVSYFIDPRIMDDKTARDIREITLSYTFYRVEQPETASLNARALLPPPASVR